MPESETPKSRSPLPVIAAALALGVIAGAAVLYVKAQGSGNQAADAQTSCPFDKTKAEALNAAAKGEVAAMLATDEPQPSTVRTASPRPLRIFPDARCS
jgi:hypothetical protein